MICILQFTLKHMADHGMELHTNAVDKCAADSSIYRYKVTYFTAVACIYSFV